MNRIALILLFAWSASVNVCAQLHYGLEVGTHFNHVNFDRTIIDSEARQGFFIGPKIRATIEELGLGGDAALRYAQKSISVVDDLNAEGRQTYEKNDMSYIQVPVNLRWDIGLEQLGIFITTGPQWDWYIGDADWSDAENFSATFDHSSFSWNVGAGVHLFGHLDVGISYNFPMSSQGSYFSKAYDAFRQTAEEIKMKHYSWQVSLAVYL